MSYGLPDGAIVSIASEYDDTVAMSALSNAANAIATVPADSGLAANDIVVIGSGWLKADRRVARLSAVAAAAATLALIDTSDLKRFPASSGVGTLQKITAWTQISQITAFETSGGDQNFANVEFLDDDEQRQLPTSKSPTSLAITIADDPEKPHNAILAKADEDRIPRVIRLDLPSGAVLYYNGFVSFNSSPQLTKGNIMTVKATVALVSRFTRYTA